MSLYEPEQPLAAETSTSTYEPLSDIGPVLCDALARVLSRSPVHGHQAQTDDNAGERLQWKSETHKVITVSALPVHSRVSPLEALRRPRDGSGRRLGEMRGEYRRARAGCMREQTRSRRTRPLLVETEHRT